MRQIVSGQIQYPYQRGGETDNFLDRQGHRVRGEKNQTDGLLDITGNIAWFERKQMAFWTEGLPSHKREEQTICISAEIR
jgi:hypothetical protein